MIKALILLTFVFLAAPGVSAQAPQLLTEKDYLRVAPDAGRGFMYPYYLYVPPEISSSPDKKRVFTILVIPNNTGVMNDSFETHEADVRRRILTAGPVGSALKAAVLLPVFPRPQTDWRIYTHALDRDSMVTKKKELRRLDLQLIAMIGDARRRMKKQGINFDERVLLNGFSAQAMFANRFTFLHPDRVKAAVIGSPGGWPIVPAAEYKSKKLRYPIGIADIKEVAGRRIDMERLRRVPLFIFLGDRDENDSVKFDDSYDQEDRDLIFPLFGEAPVSRWETAKQLYKSAGLNAEFRLYNGVGHTITPEIRADIRSFLLKYAQ